LCIGAADGYGENRRLPMTMLHPTRDLPRRRRPPHPDVTSPCGQRWPQLSRRRPPEIPFAARLLPIRDVPSSSPPCRVDTAAKVGRHTQPIRQNRYPPTSLGHLVTHPMPACGRPPDAPAAYVGLRVWATYVAACRL